MLNALGEISEKDAVKEWSLIEEEPVLKLGTLNPEKPAIPEKYGHKNRREAFGQTTKTGALWIPEV